MLEKLLHTKLSYSAMHWCFPLIWKWQTMVANAHTPKWWGTVGVTIRCPHSVVVIEYKTSLNGRYMFN